LGAGKEEAASLGDKTGWFAGSCSKGLDHSSLGRANLNKALPSSPEWSIHRRI